MIKNWEDILDNSMHLWLFPSRNGTNWMISLFWGKKKKYKKWWKVINSSQKSISFKVPSLFSVTMISSTQKMMIEIFWASWAMKPLMDFDKFSWSKMMRKETMKLSKMWLRKFSTKIGKYTKLGRINLYPITPMLLRGYRPPSTTELPGNSSWKKVEKSIKKLNSND